MRTHAKLILYFSGAIAILDGILKAYAIRNLPDEGARLSSPIGFALHKNPGIAFDIPIPLVIIIAITVLITAALMRFVYVNWKSRPIASAFAGMVTCGALGNMIDRIINGFTTDYIILFNLSAINLSDILILLGILLLLSYPESKEAR